MIASCNFCTTDKNKIEVSEKQKLKYVLKKCNMTRVDVYNFLLEKCNLTNDYVIEEIKTEICKENGYGPNYEDCDCKINCSREYYLDPSDEIGVVKKCEIVTIKGVRANSSLLKKNKTIMKKYLGDNYVKNHPYLFQNNKELKNIGLTVTNHLMKCLFCVIDNPKMNEYLVKYLDSCEDINAVTSTYGFTALHIVCELFGRSRNEALIKTAQILIDAGANVNAITHFGSSPLHILMYHFCDDCDYKKEKEATIIKIFISHGADIFEERDNVISVYNYSIFDDEIFSEFVVDCKNKTITRSGNLTKRAIV